MLQVFTENGRDTIKLAPSLGRVSNELLGGPNADTIVGGPYNDFIAGGIGDDRLYGGGGNDDIVGESGNFRFPDNPGDNLLVGGAGDDHLGYRYDIGVDRFLGGPGQDVFNARDKERDAQINAGADHDRCRIDTVDPPPRSCEHLNEVRPNRSASAL